MSDERKNQSLEIQQYLAEAKYDNAAMLCETYLRTHPNDVQVWWYYVLADCRAKNIKTLAKRNVDLSKNPIFIKAASELNDRKRECLYEMKSRVESYQVSENASNADYASCKRYFVNAIKGIKSDIESLKEEINRTIDEKKIAFQTIGKKSVRLYGNNFFGFIMLTVLCLLPFAVISVLMKLFGISTGVSLIPIIIAAIIIVVRLVFRSIKHKKFMKELPVVYETCERTEGQLIEQKFSYKTKTVKKKNMMKIYKRLKKNPGMNAKSVIKLRDEFDRVYLEN